MSARLYRVRLLEVRYDFLRGWAYEYFVAANNPRKAIQIAKEEASIGSAACAVQCTCIRGGSYRTKFTTLLDANGS